MYERNCFITLSYDQQNVPVDFSVKLRDWQLFMKKLRKHVGQSTSNRLRFFACGEYGDKSFRPHYHSLIFNYDFPDKIFLKTRNGYPVYKSETLDTLWGKSQVNEVGQVSFSSAAYVARYCMKKLNGDHADDYYTRLSPIDGQYYRVAPEFCVMSRRPGIGTSWFDQFAGDAFPSDFVIVDGHKVKPPRFYLNKLEEGEALVLPKTRNKNTQLVIKRARRAHANLHRTDNTKDRLKVREELTKLKLKRLEREL